MVRSNSGLSWNRKVINYANRISLCRLHYLIVQRHRVYRWWFDIDRWFVWADKIYQRSLTHPKLIDPVNLCLLMLHTGETNYTFCCQQVCFPYGWEWISVIVVRFHHKLNSMLHIREFDCSVEFSKFEVLLQRWFWSYQCLIIERKIDS